MIIRPAGDRDADCIADIYNHYVRVGGATFDAQAWTIGQTRHLLNSDDCGVWIVACPQDEEPTHAIDGWASARRFSARYGYRHSLESAVYVRENRQRSGVGMRLMQTLIDRCKQMDIHHLMARISSDNRASIQFHHNLGYETVGVQKEVGRMNDQWLDVMLLQKLL